MSTPEQRLRRAATARARRDPEKDRERNRAWRAQNREENNARRRATRDRDKENARTRDWRAQNSEKVRVWAERDREKQRVWQTRRVHGMEPEDWAAMWAAQDGCCYLCGADLAKGRAVNVDHDHSCCPQGRSCRACRRGLACHSCNVAIGMADDDPARLRRMADALETAKRTAAERIASREMAEQFTLL